MKLLLISESGPSLKTLKDNIVDLSDDELAKVMAAKATWNSSNSKKPTPAIKKAVVRNKTYYFSNTHRTWASAKSLSKALKDFKNIVKPSS